MIVGVLKASRETVAIVATLSFSHLQCFAEVEIVATSPQASQDGRLVQRQVSHHVELLPRVTEPLLNCRPFPGKEEAVDISACEHLDCWVSHHLVSVTVLLEPPKSSNWELLPKIASVWELSGFTGKKLR